MTREVRMEVRMKSEESCLMMFFWAEAEGFRAARRTRSRGERPRGRIQRVVMKRARRETWRSRRAIENGRDRKVSSLTNFQFTVHSYLNERVSSKARPRYAQVFLRKKGSPISNY